MKKGIIIAGAVLSLTTLGLRAADDRGDKATIRYEEPTPSQRFRADELNVDLFGGLTVSEDVIDNISRQRVEDNGRLGAGAGATYFISRHVGIGGEGYSENTAHSLVDHASGSLVIRFPLGESGIAPYIFGGAGHIFDPLPATSGHGGGGIEFRLNPRFGIFADARMVFTDKLGNYGLGRAGIRLAF
jgi:hypothetical protein